MNSPKITVVISMYNCEQYVQGVLSMFAEQLPYAKEVLLNYQRRLDNMQY